jgi:hypothetical protein
LVLCRIVRVRVVQGVAPVRILDIYL